MIVELTLLPIAMIVVFLRLWVRIAWLKKSWWDDYLMIVALVFSMGTTVLVIMVGHIELKRQNELLTQGSGNPNLRMGQACMGSHVC